jgi:hypothetical protein
MNFKFQPHAHARARTDARAHRADHDTSTCVHAGTTRLLTQCGSATSQLNDRRTCHDPGSGRKLAALRVATIILKRLCDRQGKPRRPHCASTCPTFKTALVQTARRRVAHCLSYLWNTTHRRRLRWPYVRVWVGGRVSASVEDHERLYCCWHLRPVPSRLCHDNCNHRELT